MPIILIIKTEDKEITELPILNKVIMGRSGNCDYKIADTKMSATHCSFQINSSGQLLFTDLGSSNGSFINNSQIQQTLVRVNDIIRIGNTLIKIDEKRLSTSERLSVGASLVRKSDKTLPDMSKIGAKVKSPEEEEKERENSPKKKTILLNKAHKEKKKIGSNWSGTENIIDQEESSGHTKFLKLDKKKK